MRRVTQEAVPLPAAAAAGSGADLQEGGHDGRACCLHLSLELLSLGAAGEPQEKTGC